jgi:hypothetical protein
MSPTAVVVAIATHCEGFERSADFPSGERRATLRFQAMRYAKQGQNWELVHLIVHVHFIVVVRVA